MPKPDRSIRDAVLAHAEEMRTAGAIMAPAWSDICAKALADRAHQVEEAVQFYFKAKVAYAKVVLPDGKTPLARIVLKFGNKRKTVPQVGALQALLEPVFDVHKPDLQKLSLRLESLWDPQLAMLRKAEVTEAVSRAMADDSKMAPIVKRAKEFQEKEKKAYLHRIRSAIATGDVRTITEDDLVEMWRESCVARVLAD